MPQISLQIPRPVHWQDFEDLCWALFRKEWDDPVAAKNGRGGQEQKGVDVYGRNKHDGQRLWGVQCKGKDVNYGAKLTIAEIDAELEKADTFTPTLAHWIIATTAPVDVHLQEYANTLTEKRKEMGLCPVTVLGWEAIADLLRGQEDVYRAYYPSHFENKLPASKFHMPQAFHLSDYFSDPLNHLQTLREQLLAQGETAVLAKANVQGMGGVGKTQLALKYSLTFKDLYAGVWWFGAETQAGLESDCLLFCEKQGIAVAQNESPGSAVRDWLAGQGNWLLVYDNAEEVKMVRPFLPQGGKHHVLLTSRNPHWGGMKSLPLGVWDEEQGLQFLRERLGADEGEDGELKALSRALDGLPLALEQACAYILISKMPVVKYIVLLTQHETATRLLKREDASGCARSVLATLSLAFEQLSAAAQELLTLCSWLAAEPIPVYLFTEQPDKLPSALQAAVQDELAWRDTLAELEKYALCQVAPMVLKDHAGNGDEEVDCLTFHRLTQAAERIGGSGRETLLVLELPYDCQEPKNWPHFKVLTPHVFYLNECYQEQWDVGVHFGWLLNQLAVYLKNGPALYQTALPLYLRGLAIIEKVYGPEHLETGRLLNNLGGVYRATGDYAAAISLLERGFALVEKTQGQEHPETGKYLNNLAELYRATGDYPVALLLYMKALAIAEKNQGQEHPEVGVYLNNLAFLYCEMGDYVAALRFCQKALAIAEKSKGPEHPDTGMCLNNLTLMYCAMGNYGAAFPLCLRALAIAEKTQGPEHPETGKSLNNLAELYRATGDYDAALPLFLRALAIAEKAQGPEHPETGTSLNNLAMLYEAMGEYGVALPLYLRALAIAEKALGPLHPKSKTIRANLADLQSKMNPPT